MMMRPNRFKIKYKLMKIIEWIGFAEEYEVYTY